MMKRTSDLRISRSDALPLSHRDFTVSDEIIKFDISLITDFSNDYILNRPTKPLDVYSRDQPRNRNLATLQWRRFSNVFHIFVL